MTKSPQSWAKLVVFEIGRKGLSMPFKVLENSLVPVVLGVTWLEQQEAVLDFQTSVLTFGENPREQIPFSTKRQ